MESSALEIAAIVIAVIAVIFAGLSWRASRDSVKEAKRASDAAERSAGAAEESVQLQRQEAKAAQEERMAGQKADVIPLYWEGRGGHDPRGLVIRNQGKAPAREVLAYEAGGSGDVRKWSWASITPGETVGLLGGETHAASEEDAYRSKPEASGPKRYARIEWTNADGSLGLTAWREIQVRQ